MKRASLSFVFLVAVAATASASPIMWVDDARGNLGTVDVATGASTVIGNTGQPLTDIAFDPFGNLWGVTFNALYSINKTTAAATLVGNLGLTGANALVFATDGTLYTAAFNSQDLYTVNTATGAATSLGTMGFMSAGDLAFNGGNFYLAGLGDHLIKINLANLGLTSDIGSFGVTDMFGLATASDGILYGVAGLNVYTVNTTTGAATAASTFNGSSLEAAFGQSFLEEAGAAVPEPATILLVGGGLSAAWRRRRQRRA